MKRGFIHFIHAKKKASLMCSRSLRGGTLWWYSHDEKHPAQPAAGPYSKSSSAPSTLIADGASPSTSAVSLTMTLYRMKVNSSCGEQGREHCHEHGQHRDRGGWLASVNPRLWSA